MTHLRREDAVSGPEHGTYARYAGAGRGRAGCRCEPCRKAKADYMRQRREAARQQARPHTAGPDGGAVGRYNAFAPGAQRHHVPGITHGRYGYEERGCRCRECTTARYESHRGRRPA